MFKWRKLNNNQNHVHIILLYVRLVLTLVYVNLVILRMYIIIYVGIFNCYVYMLINTTNIIQVHVIPYYHTLACADIRFGVS